MSRNAKEHCQGISGILLRVLRLARIFRLHQAVGLMGHAPMAEADHHAVVFVMAEKDIWFFRFYKAGPARTGAMFAHFGIEYQVPGMPWQPGEKKMAFWLDRSQYTQF